MPRSTAWLVVLVVGSGWTAGCGGGSGSDDAGRWDARGNIDANTIGEGRPCARGSDCDNGVFCDGMELCVDAVCVDGTPPCNISASQLCDEGRRVCTGIDCLDESMADQDGDGRRSHACGGDDCDDLDPNRFPGNPEVCDVAGHDEDCDPNTYGFRDADGDSAPDASCCNGDTCGTDCDDMNPSRNPSVPEVCGNGVDDDCDGIMDEGSLLAGFVDADGDGYGDDSMPTTACPGTPMFATRGGD